MTIIESGAGPSNIESGTFKFEGKLNSDTFDTYPDLGGAAESDATPVYGSTTEPLAAGLAEGGADVAGVTILGTIAISAIALAAVVLAVIAVVDLVEDIHNLVDDDADEATLKRFGRLVPGF